jgi:protein SCO1
MLDIVRSKSWGGAAGTRLAAGLLACALYALTPGSAFAENPYGAGYFPNLPLLTQDGKTVNFYEDLLKGKSVAINVIYTSCTDECPLETAKLAQLARLFGDKMGKDIFFYSISIDPKHDTPAVLKAYAKNFNVGPGWLFLTGKEADIKTIVKKIGLSRGSDGANKDGHTASLMVGNEPTGQWMRNSAVDNPVFLSASIGSFLGWRDDPSARKTYAEANAMVLDPGEYMFQSRCSVCHTMGNGDKIGPDLAGVTARHDRSWVARYLMAPAKMRAEGDPTALALAARYRTAMPDQKLGGADLTAILSYLEARSGVARGAAPQETAQKKDGEHKEHTTHMH